MTSNKNGRGVVIKDPPQPGTAAYPHLDTLRPGTLLLEINGEEATNFSRSDLAPFLDEGTYEVRLVVRVGGGAASYKVLTHEADGVSCPSLLPYFMVVEQPCSD